MTIDIIPRKAVFRVDEVARLFDLHERSIYRWIEEEKIKAVKLPNGQYRIRREWILAIYEKDDTPSSK